MNACIGSDFAGLSRMKGQQREGKRDIGSEREEWGRGEEWTYDNATSHAFFIFKSFARSTLARTTACCSSAPSPIAFFPLPYRRKTTLAVRRGMKGERHTLLIGVCVDNGA
jgi:hypothetical protein